MLGSFLMVVMSAGMVSWDISEVGKNWQIVNDTVMGGRSSAKLEYLNDGSIVFSGKVSLQNNGGFASFRSRDPKFRLDTNGSFILSVMGDGRSYTMDLRTGMMRGAFSWKQEFSTEAGKVLNIKLPLDKFYPTSFGRRLPSVTRLSPSAVKSVGFMLYDGEGGPFSLKILKLNYEEEKKEMPKTVLSLMDFAINRGVPIFNRGDHEACAAIYETALKSALVIPDSSFSEDLRKTTSEEVEKGGEIGDHAERAWAYRRTMNKLIETLTQVRRQSL